MYPKNYFKKFSKFYLLVLLLLIFTVPIALSGCGGGGGSSSGSSSNTATSSSTISGTVDGGPTPLNYQVTVSLYESGYSTPLGSTTTSNGNFTINFHNPSSTGLLYIVVQGSGANSNIQLLSIVESSQNSNLSKSGVVVNELSTVASEYIANAFNMNFNSLNFPSNLSGVSLTTTLNNLIMQFHNLYNSTGSNAGSLNSNSSVNSSTQNTIDIDILADAISGCVSNPSGSVCSSLYNDASSSPGEQISEIVYSIITNNTSNLPSNYSLSNIYTLASKEASTTGWSIPSASAAPTSLTFNMPVFINTSYMPSNITNTTSIGSTAVDSSGNLWTITDTYSSTSGYYTDQLVEISNGSIAKTINLAGSPSTSPYGNKAYALAIDSSGNIWLTDQVYNASSNSYIDQLLEVSNGNIVKTISLPNNVGNALEIDSAGNIWVPTYTYSSTNTNAYSDELVEVSSNGTIEHEFTMPSNATGQPEGIAIDDNGNIWIPTYNYNNSTKLSSYELVEVSSGGNVLNILNLPGANYGDILIDPSGNIWLSIELYDSTTSTSSYELIEISNDKIIKTIPIYTNITNGNEGINCIAIDYAGNLWVGGYNNYDSSTDTYTGQLFEITNGTITNTINIGNYDPWGITIDQSGDIIIPTNNYINISGAYGYYSGNIIELKNAAEGEEYFPYQGPEYAKGTNGSKVV